MLRTNCNKTQIRYFDFKKSNWLLLSQNVNRHITIPNGDTTLNTVSIDKSLEELVKIITDGITHSVPFKNKRNTNRQLPQHVKSLIRSRNHYRRKLVR